MKQHTIQIATAFALLASSAVHAQQAVQWRVEDGGNGHWYKRVPVTGGVGWANAIAAAEAVRAHLVSITSAPENAFLVANGAQGYDLLGASTPPDQGCSATTWRWASGESWGYTNWAQYEPSLHCQETVLVFSQANFPRWNNFYGGSNGFWIEWDADCNFDGIVDYGQILQGQLADTNTDGIPDACQCVTNPSLPSCCVGDINGDHSVDGADIGLMLYNWGPCGSVCLADLNSDGSVNGGDIGLLLSDWGPCTT